MRRLFRPFAILGALSLVAGFLTLGFAGVASAATPPWQTSPPALELGGLLFYNAAGQQITGGSTTVAPFAKYVKGTTVLNSGDSQATLFAYTPTLQAPGNWSGEQLGGTTTYPNASAPAPLNTAAPLFTGATTDTTLASYALQFPNTLTNTGYQGVYELRLKSSNPTTTTTYDATDIQITGTTWSVVYPSVVLNPTTIALTATPPSTQTFGQSVSLSATISPAVAGSIQFENNGSAIGAPVSETNGTAATTTAALGVTLPLGSDTLDAVFTPAANLAYSGSSTASESASGPYSITPIGTHTTISSVTPSSPQYAGTSETIDATVTNNDSTTPSGTVQFEYQLNGSGPEQVIGSAQPVSAGAASVTTSSLPVGTDDLSAVFSPSSPDYASSTATVVPFTIQTPPGDTTSTALSVDPTSATSNTLVQLTASVANTSTTATTNGPTGTVTFYDNGATDSNVITGGSIALETVDLGAGGTVSVTYPISPAGTHYIVAQFNSSNLALWADSTSAQVEYVATGQSSPAPAAQNVEVDIPAGTLTITTPYSPTNPFNLGTATLNAGAGTFSASAAFGSLAHPSQGVTITDTGIGENTWTASAEVTNFTSGGEVSPSDDISGENLTFTGVTPGYIAANDYGTPGTNGGSIAINTNSVGNGGTVFPAGASGNQGLAGVPHAFASSSASGTGSVYVYGLLNLVAPSSVTPGEYTATLTFTIV